MSNPDFPGSVAMLDTVTSELKEMYYRLLL